MASVKSAGGASLKSAEEHQMVALELQVEGQNAKRIHAGFVWM